MQAILSAPVDLLWFGGIGTYVRASTETDAEVGDRANDAIRITGLQVRAKVVGEGANLGCTQRGRIEAARAGIRLNTDAIDNSAGVNTSDVEVNIKIALNVPERDGRLSPQDRNSLLASMTDEVAGLVLRNNYLQSLALSLAERRGAAELAPARTLMHRLEREARLDRAVENLPDDRTLDARALRGEALTRPELAVLLAYAKLALHDDLLASPLPDDPHLAGELTRYFPKPLRERFPDAIAGHRLRREIIATQIANAVINRGGPSLVARLADETGATPPAIARAYILTRDAFGLLDLNLAIDALDGAISGATQLALYGAVQDALVARMTWFLRNIDVSRPLDGEIQRFAEGVRQIAASHDGGSARMEARQRWAGLGVPHDLADRMASLALLEAAPEAVLTAEASGAPADHAADALFAVARGLGLDGLKLASQALKPADRFERLAVDRALERADLGVRSLAITALSRRIAAEALVGSEAARQTRQQIAALLDGAVTPAKLSVAASLIDDLARVSAR
jgi:glutamate dehydrogenase